MLSQMCVGCDATDNRIAFHRCSRNEGVTTEQHSHVKIFLVKT